MFNIERRFYKIFLGIITLLFVWATGYVLSLWLYVTTDYIPKDPLTYIEYVVDDIGESFEDNDVWYDMLPDLGKIITYPIFAPYHLNEDCKDNYNDSSKYFCETYQFYQFDYDKDLTMYIEYKVSDLDPAKTGLYIVKVESIDEMNNYLTQEMDGYRVYRLYVADNNMLVDIQDHINSSEGNLQDGDLTDPVWVKDHDDAIRVLLQRESYADADPKQLTLQEVINYNSTALTGTVVTTKVEQGTYLMFFHYAITAVVTLFVIRDNTNKKPRTIGSKE